MLDMTTPKGQLIAAALKLAGERPWKDVTLIDVAEEARVSLAELRGAFDGKGAILRGFVRAVDDELLRKTKRPQAGEAPRDALFEVIMARLDLLGPHKPAIRSIFASTDPDLAMVRTALASQHWMLQAAGIEAEGASGVVRTLGLTSLYASVFRTWLDDDDPGMARTMAALDRRLRRGERNLKALDDVCGMVSGVAKQIGGLFGGARRGSDRKPEASASDAGSARDGG